MIIVSLSAQNGRDKDAKIFWKDVMDERD